MFTKSRQKILPFLSDVRESESVAVHPPFLVFPRRQEKGVMYLR